MSGNQADGTRGPRLDDDDQGAESSEALKRLTTYAMLGHLMREPTR